MGTQGQLRVLTLYKGQNHDTTIFRLEKGWSLHFVLGPELADKPVRVFTNHPADPKAGPDRYKFHELSWQNYSSHKSDVYDNYAECGIVLAGSFNYYFTIDGSDVKENANGHGCFLVDPVLKVGRYDERLPLDCITCQTVLSKNLGPFPQWRDRLRVAKESGYNMLHFTPLHALGASNSAYSLMSQDMLNPVFSPAGGETFTFDHVAHLVEEMKTEWEVMSLTDLVFNHTANESAWIQEHPECVYNVINSPHLKPAYLLDRILWHFTLEVAEGDFENRGIPAEVRNEDHINAIRYQLQDVIIPRHNIHEYYLPHVDECLQHFRNAILSGQKADPRDGADLSIIADPKFRRLKSTIDMPLALYHFNKPRDGCSEEDRVNQCCEALRWKLNELNGAKYNEVQSHLGAAVNNFLANVRWRFVDGNGPRVERVSAKEPLMYNYFLLPKDKLTVQREEELMHTTWGYFAMAHNGWVMGDDPLRNFAEAGSNVYLRRELIPWGDSVKLRFGKSPQDCPFLWEHMRQYAVQAATVFHGVRLDNCHSTPIHVAEYMLDEARKVRPDLYIIAELFTSSEQLDNTFINRLGLNSLIREGLTACDSHELGRLVHRFGGQPVGAFIQPPARPLVPTMAHAIFFDQTHDNQSPIDVHCAFDLLPSSALVAMASCATGSNRGYDEMVPHHINVVTEERIYRSFTDNSKAGQGYVNSKSGIIAAKRALNVMHQELGAAGFNQVYVDQVDHDIVSVTRHNPVSHQSVILVARTAFSHPHNFDTGFVPPLSVPGVIDEIILEARVAHKSDGTPYKRDGQFINGLTDHQLQLREHIKVYESEIVELKDIGEKHLQEVEFVNFPPGSVIAFKVSLDSTVKNAILYIRKCLSQFGYRMHTYSGRNLQEICSSDLETIASRLNMNDINRILYRCAAEEKDDGKGSGGYELPGIGELPYCGLQGVISVFSRIRSSNDLGHPLCENLRNGDWMPHYIASRLQKFQGTKELGNWFADTFEHLSQVPRYLIPCYFDAIVTGVYMIVEEVAWAKMPPFIHEGSSFVRALSMGSLQFCSFLRTALLPRLSAKLTAPCPPTILNEETGQKEQCCPTVAAGMPHFASGIFRNWGRDTFIALRGTLLLTGRYEEARFIILGYAGALRHGLIPNLLGEGAFARYNCRDAIWWWLQCIQDYCNIVPNGVNILKDTVSRLYPADDMVADPATCVDQPLYDVIQDALQRHSDGCEFRERNAGPAVDNDMTDNGFNVSYRVNWDTGFPVGGNENNCGTWMDKMGSSAKAGNKGKPATPRDGSAVELVGLCASAVRWLAQMHKQGLYPYDSVERELQVVLRTSRRQSITYKRTKITFAVWAQLLHRSFERYFWISSVPRKQFEPRPELINRRTIYKDSYGASQPWADFQLRCNYPIAMVVAPELFTPENAWSALCKMTGIMVGPLGMKTLDPTDWAYNGNYINSDDSDDASRAKGFNYHQGPEWVWPVGFFLRAKLYFAKVLEPRRPGVVAETVRYIKQTLSLHNVHIQNSEWKSLPELTNKDGAVCYDSCPAQAWSMGCILEVLYDLEKLVADGL